MRPFAGLLGVLRAVPRVVATGPDEPLLVHDTKLAVTVYIDETCATGA